MPEPAERDLRFLDIPDPLEHRALGEPRSAPDLPPSPTRADRRRRALAALLATPTWIAIAALGLGLRGDVADAPVLARILIWSALGLVALFALLRPRARGLPSGARAVEACLVAVPLLYAAFVLAIPGNAGRAIERTLLPGAPYVCIPLSILIAAVPLALAAWILRRTFLSLPGLRGATVGAICGVAGAVAMHAHCPVETSLHLLLGHGTAILVCALLGALLGALRGRA